MDALLLAVIVGLAFLAAYVTYGRWVARRVFQLREDAPTPAVLTLIEAWASGAGA